MQNCVQRPVVPTLLMTTATQPPYIPTGGPNDLLVNPLMQLLAQMPPEMLLGIVNGRLGRDPQAQAPPPIIQPDLESASELQQDDNDDADDKGNREQIASRPKKKKKSMKDKERMYLLNHPLQDLSPAEKMTCEELQKCLDDVIFDVTGILMDTIEDDDSNNQDSDDMTEADKMHFDFSNEKGVKTTCNKMVLDHVTKIVWDEQSNNESCTLGHNHVKFTQKDVLAFAKDKFCNLKRKYLEVTDDIKRQKRQQHKLKKDCAEQDIIDAYIKAYGIDPTPILETEYMSEEISQLDTDDDAGLKDSNAEDGVVVWEVVCEAWRSVDFNLTIEQLDKIRWSVRRESGQAKRGHTKRVNLGTLKNDALDIMVYPFMISTDWLVAYNTANPGIPLQVKAKNPPGFGHQGDQLQDEGDSNNEQCDPSTRAETEGSTRGGTDRLGSGDISD
ncbi:hypothetical protein BDR05DRAFT_993938 [Suillus weaverae]|nr:hypothetical protein BDR05DRAFT_993938 [Suillus weaverae]